MATGGYGAFGGKWDGTAKGLVEAKELWEREEAKRRDHFIKMEALRAKTLAKHTYTGITSSGTALYIPYTPLPHTTTGTITIDDTWDWGAAPIQTQYVGTITVIDLTTKRTSTTAYPSKFQAVPLTLIRTWDGLYMQHSDTVRQLKGFDDIPAELKKHLSEETWKLLAESFPSEVVAVRPQEGVYAPYDDEAGF